MALTIEEQHETNDLDHDMWLKETPPTKTRRKGAIRLFRQGTSINTDD